MVIRLHVISNYENRTSWRVYFVDFFSLTCTWTNIGWELGKEVASSSINLRLWIFKPAIVSRWPRKFAWNMYVILFPSLAWSFMPTFVRRDLPTFLTKYRRYASDKLFYRLRECIVCSPKFFISLPPFTWGGGRKIRDWSANESDLGRRMKTKNFVGE